jgi:uridylate kinase
MKNEKIIVISVGGSLIVPEEIDTTWVKNFKQAIDEFLKKGYRFVIICGGGKIARKYQTAAKNISELTRDDVDWIGIHCTRLNAHFFRTIFRKDAYFRIIKNPTEKIKFDTKILIAAGWKPGFSTDYDAILIAKNFSVKKVINLTNIDYICDKDPNKYEDAKAIKETTWKEFRKLIPSEWSPGLNLPFDPIAAKEAEKTKIEVAIINGKNIESFKNYLNEKEFKGTLIK